VTAAFNALDDGDRGRRSPAGRPAGANETLHAIY